MKWKKICQYLCLLIVTACSILITSSLTVFAAHADESMKVIAHIETAPNETENIFDNVTSADEVNKPADSNKPQTADNSNLWLWNVLLIISLATISGTVVYVKKKKQNKQ